MEDYPYLYKLSIKITVAAVLVVLVFLSFYYVYDYILELSISNQNQNLSIDPLDNLSDSSSSVQAIDSFNPLLPESDISQVQKSNILSIIKANTKITESEKKKIMRELEGYIE